MAKDMLESRSMVGVEGPCEGGAQGYTWFDEQTRVPCGVRVFAGCDATSCPRRGGPGPNVLKITDSELQGAGYSQADRAAAIPFVTDAARNGFRLDCPIARMEDGLPPQQTSLIGRLIDMIRRRQ